MRTLSILMQLFFGGVLLWAGAEFWMETLRLGFTFQLVVVSFDCLLFLAWMAWSLIKLIAGPPQAA